MADALGPGREPSHWIWGKGLPAYCDWRIPDEFPDPPTIVAVPPFMYAQYPAFDHTDLIDDPERFDAIEDGALVWVRGSWLPSFVAQVLPRLRAQIVLVTGDSDASFPSAAGAAGRALLDSPSILHWYTQNYDGTAPLERVSPLPIGLDFHTLSDRPQWGEPVTPQREQEAGLDAIVASLPPLDQRIPQLYVDFSWQAGNGSIQDDMRGSIIRLLADHPLVVHQHERLPRSEMWRRKGQYAFSLSPRGAGLDCHRTWEALVLGQVVLFPSSSLNPMFEGLRAFRLEYWEELTMPNLVRWLARAQQLPAPEAALTNAHWIERMRVAADRRATRP